MLSRLLLIAFCAVVAGQSVTSCGGPGDHLQNVTIALTPDPIVKGQTLTIKAEGTLDEDTPTLTRCARCPSLPCHDRALARTAHSPDAPPMLTRSLPPTLPSILDLSIEALGIIHSSATGALPLTITPGAQAGPFGLTIGPIAPPTNIPGKVVVTGTVHVVNGKGEAVMCLKFDLTIPGAAAEEKGAPLPLVVAPVHQPAAHEGVVGSVSSCGGAADHIKDFAIATSAAGVTTMGGALDEAVSTLSLVVDVKIKVLLIGIPIKMTIPIGLSPGMKPGQIGVVAGPSAVVLKPSIKSTVTGTIKVNDGNGEELACLALAK